MGEPALRMSGQYAQEIAKLRAENDQLRAEILLMKFDREAGNTDLEALINGFKLTYRQAQTLLKLYRSPPNAIVSKTSIHSSIWGDKGNPQIVDVMVSHLRTRLKDRGISFVRYWGVGIALAKESRPVIAEIIARSK